MSNNISKRFSAAFLGQSMRGADRFPVSPPSPQKENQPSIKGGEEKTGPSEKLDYTGQPNREISAIFLAVSRWPIGRRVIYG